MNPLKMVLLAGILLCSTKVFALGIDIGPVHLHGTKVKVGDDMDLKIVADRINRDEDQKERVRKISGHRKGDSDDKFEIRVVWSDLDDNSKDVLKDAKVDDQFSMKLQKFDDDWKLLKVRKED